MTRLFIKFACAFLKKRGARRAIEIKRLNAILSDYWAVYSADSMKPNELERFHTIFRFYTECFDTAFSNSINQEDRHIIVHAIEASRVLCWLLKYQSITDPEIVKIMQDRAERILCEGAHHSSEEGAIRLLCSSGWAQNQTPSIDQLRNARDWCRANMDRLRDLQMRWENELINYDLLKEIA
jgi:hypothetical protein